MNISATVIRKTAVIYKSNAIDSEVIGEAQPGGEVIVLSGIIGNDHKWMKAKLPDGQPGWVLGKVTEQGHHKMEFLPYYLPVHLHIGIVHQETTDHNMDAMPGIMPGTAFTWKLIRKPPFIMDIIRPETGFAMFSMTCPYCGKQLDAIFPSIQKLTEKKPPLRWKDKKKAVFILILILLVIIGFHAAFYLLNAFQTTGLGIFFFFCYIIWAVIFITLLSYSGNTLNLPSGMGGGISIDGKLLDATALNDRFSGHYIAWIKDDI